MSKTPLKVQEFNINIFTSQNNPTISNPNYFHYSGIVGSDWQLAHAPLHTNNFLRLTFTNGIGIVLERNKIVFLELLKEKTPEQVLTPSMARKYISAMPNMDYQRVLINFIGHVPFSQQPDAPLKYLTETLLSPGPWLEFGQATVSTGVKFVYTLEKCLLRLNVSEGIWRLPDETIVPVVLFLGDFEYNIVGDSILEQLDAAMQILENWQDNLETYLDLINTKFFNHLQKQPRGTNCFSQETQSTP